MKRIIFVCLLLFAAWHFSPNKSGSYTVEFISSAGDTTYLLNSNPLSYKEAVRIANGYSGKAEPVPFNERPFAVK